MNFVRSLNGVEHIELWLEHLPEAHAEIAALKHAVDGFNLIVHAPFIHRTLMSHSSAIAEISIAAYRKTLEISEKLGAQVVTFHGGNYPTHIGEESAFEQLCGNLANLVSENRQVVVAIENLPFKGGAATNFPTLLGQLQALRRRVPLVRFTVDVGHCVQNDDDYGVFLRECSSLIANIHLHDARSRGQGHLCLGKGQLDLDELLQQLWDVQYYGFLTLETLGQEDTAKSWQVLLDTEQKISEFGNLTVQC